jgi:simple sugar transport system ATP-binding protein
VPVLELNNISKRFGNLLANENISLALDAGEIVALLGENGAGKTTLMNILFGHYSADEGWIKVNGEILPNHTEAAINAGIGMVHQHFTLADNLSVMENIVLGTESLFAWRQDRAKASKRLENLSHEFGLEIDAQKQVSELTVGERQRVEILKAIYRDVKILILDEPTAVLTPQETEKLFSSLKDLSKKGLTIIFITHKLHEILSVTDRVAVLRRGKLVGEVLTKEADKNILSEMMVGHKVSYPSKKNQQYGDIVVELDNISTVGEKGESSVQLHNITLQVRSHQILGIVGVSGNGQLQLARLLSGMIQHNSGTMNLFGNTIEKNSPLSMIRQGVARIPEDRHTEGIVGEMKLWENLIGERLSLNQMTHFGCCIDKKSAIQHSEQLIDDFDIRCSGTNAQANLLSGGNIQKLILARTLTQNPGFIVANQPVRGLDEGSIAYVQTQLMDARNRGAGILLISTDIDELLTMCDDLMVMCDGYISKVFKAESKSISEIGLMMAGQLGTDNTSIN